MSLSEVRVAVVVVTYNSERLLPDLLAALGPGLGALSWHLTVADNASADGTVATLRRLAPAATVVEMGRNAGYAAGINAAVAAAPPHAAVLVLNPDVRLRPGCVETLLAALATTGTGIAVPHIVDGAGALIPTLRREPTILRALGDAVLGARRAGRYAVIGEVVTDDRRYARETVTDWAEGSTMLISRECWQRCGPWDESFFLYSEETDFALRARDAGLVTRFVPEARAVHLEGDSRHSPRLWALLTLNRVRLYRRRHGLPRTAAYWFVLLAREASRALLGRQTSRAAARDLLRPAKIREVPGPATVHSAG
ncbi:glycosyltransferase family 2 protein [Micromonospora soli]|uniref:glycosyltransferase n=1 Tax=Micromonospora sp. NBRC 110009 TaxID=3061627 RepID=UPI00267216D6|nr:glycosyltransferase family 2 protein [Micromonospora sp. NBRC 110009]WKT98799.1 glycosyltransferase family 2 protein [Micromonospora sp. NBRC 110009]